MALAEILGRLLLSALYGRLPLGAGLNSCTSPAKHIPCLTAKIFSHFCDGPASTKLDTYAPFFVRC
jgi:hypothetical protein